jgi:translation initiation factor IF-2
VIEAKLDKGRGPLATILVRRGTLRVGDIVVVGQYSGKVRAMIDDKGRQLKEAGPSMPVEILGLSGVPSAGDPMSVVENEARAREVALYRVKTATEQRTVSAPVDIENVFATFGAVKAMEYPIVIKADTQGSVEAIIGAVNRISTDDIKVRVLSSGVGGITESDVMTAAASGAPVIGFNVRPNPKAQALAKRDRVEFQYFDVIYHLTDQVRNAMAGQLGPEVIEHVVGRAEIRQVFPAGKTGKAAGLLVTVVDAGPTQRATEVAAGMIRPQAAVERLLDADAAGCLLERIAATSTACVRRLAGTGAADPLVPAAP